MNGKSSRPLAVVSGAANGIGKACVEVFLKHDWRVVAVDSDGDLEATFPSADVLPLVVDISDVDALTKAWERVDAPATALVNAAGIFPPTTLEQLTVAQYRIIFDVNVLGTLLLSQLATRDMVDGGSVINLSSTNGFVGRSDQIVYAATKAAILSLTRSMAVGLASRTIRVNGIAPGPVDTEGFRAISGRFEEALEHAPLGRVQSPEEVAEIAWWLIDGKGAKYITGETIVCSGGFFIR